MKMFAVLCLTMGCAAHQPLSMDASLATPKAAPNIFDILISNQEAEEDVKPPKPELAVGEHYFPVHKLTEEVSDEIVDKLIRRIDWALEDKAEGMVLEINSPGGSVDAGFRLVKKMEESKLPIYCVVDNEAASMAMYILQACTDRAMTDRATVMWHEPWMGGMIAGGEKKFNNIAQRLKVLRDSSTRFIVRKTNIPFVEMVERIKGGGEWWFDVGEALDRNVIDAVYESVPALEESLRKTGKPSKKVFISPIR